MSNKDWAQYFVGEWPLDDRLMRNSCVEPPLTALFTATELAIFLDLYQQSGWLDVCRTLPSNAKRAPDDLASRYVTRGTLTVDVDDSPPKAEPYSKNRILSSIGQVLEA